MGSILIEVYRKSYRGDGKEFMLLWMRGRWSEKIKEHPTEKVMLNCNILGRGLTSRHSRQQSKQKTIYAMTWEAQVDIVFSGGDTSIRS